MRVGRPTKALGLLVATLGCGHAHVATDAPPPAAATAQSESAPPAAHESERPAKRRLRASPGETPLFTSPAAELAPDGLAKIQEKLFGKRDADGGATGRLDEPTKQALGALQRKHGLPATGVPDDATVRALGLDPSKVFRRASK